MQVNVKLAFCPTGSGGGVDPSCGKEGSGRVSKAAKEVPPVAGKGSGPTGKHLASVSRDAKVASKNAEYAVNKSSEQRAQLHDKASKAHEHAAQVHRAAGSHVAGKAHETAAHQHENRAVALFAKVAAVGGKAFGLAKGHGGGGGGKSGGGGRAGGGGGGGRGLAKKKKQIKLSFCSTGAGGGVDPSCGKGGGSSAEDKAAGAIGAAKDASAAAVAASRALNITNGHKTILGDIEQHIAAGSIGHASSQHYRAILEHQKATQVATPYKTREHHEAAKLHMAAIKKLDVLKSLKGGLSGKYK